MQGLTHGLPEQFTTVKGEVLHMVLHFTQKLTTAGEMDQAAVSTASKGA